MLFVKREDLKTGMRLARPIYNNNGVLLFERNSKLTQQGIESIRNFFNIYKKTRENFTHYIKY